MIIILTNRKKGRKLSGPATPMCLVPSSWRIWSQPQMGSSKDQQQPKTREFMTLPMQWRRVGRGLMASDLDVSSLMCCNGNSRSLMNSTKC